jgi:hypothetical protein
MRSRLLRLFSAFALVFYGGLFAAAASAAGNYSQNFSSAPANWSSINDTFVATGGYYANNGGVGTGSPERSIAYYNGTTWSTDYVYTVKLWSDYEANGNRVGIIFNLVDSDNYYEMSVRMRTYNAAHTAIVEQGSARLSKVINGTRTQVGVDFDATGVAWPENDTFFPVQVARNGNTTSIKVGNVVAYTTNDLTQLGAGRVGFFAQFNYGRFDDVSVLDASAASYLFRSGFGTGVSVTAGTCLSNYWFQDLSGGDIPGYSWRPSFWGSTTSQMFNTAAPCTDHEDYIEIGLKSVTGPTGTSSSVLAGNVKLWHPASDPTAEPRAGAQYQSFPSPGSSYYIRRYLKYPSNLLTSMGSYAWFVQHEYKTGCSPGAALPGRFLIYWKKDGAVAGNELFYELRRDTVNNCGTYTAPEWIVECRPSSGHNCPAMPVGQWFYDELYVSHPTGGTGGVVKYAINGNMVFDHTTVAGSPLPSLPNRVKMTPGYMNVQNMEILVDDLEMLAAPPCGSFPCGPPAHN